MDSNVRKNTSNDEKLIKKKIVDENYSKKTPTNCEGNDNIAAIAKQISDHAEEIYQNWKLRGLAPTEILNCSGEIGVFDKTLTPKLNDFNLLKAQPMHSEKRNDNMKRLVSSFVNEDKARQQTKKNLKLSNSTMADTLKKFETLGLGSGDLMALTKELGIEKIDSVPVDKTITGKTIGNIFVDKTISNEKVIQENSKKIMKTSNSIDPNLSKTLLKDISYSNANNTIKKVDKKNNSTSLKQNDSDIPNWNTINENSTSIESTKLGKHCVRKGNNVDKIDFENKSKCYIESNNDLTDCFNQQNDKTKNDTQQINCSSSWENPDIGITSKIKKKRNSSKCAKKSEPNLKELKGNNTKIINSLVSSEYNSTGISSNDISSVVTMDTIPPGPGSIPSATKMKLKLRNNDSTSADNQEKNIRPFLTRGSVAERVLMFEKCPDVNHQIRNILREPPKTIQNQTESHTTLQRQVRGSTRTAYIPRFFFPHGKPQATIAMETILRGIMSVFDSFPNNQMTKENLPVVLKTCGMPFYWRAPIIQCTGNASGLVEGQRFVDFWKQMSVYCHDEATRFIYILSRGQRSRQHILPEDLTTLVQDVVETHPGLAFLKEATEFHSRYVHTVISRIFYSVNRSWSGKITVAELKKSNLLQIIRLLEEEDDINQIMAFFSYEHFYVIYCKFWELDRDHDLFIDEKDLVKHNDYALSTRIIERIFSGCVTRGEHQNSPEGISKMSYTEFVWFLLSEEDKTTPTAIEYWFRCMDLDGDGILSMYELEYFYEEQQQRMESIGIETLPYEDCICQMLDMLKPYRPGCITLGDLKRCKMTPIFFDTFFNLEKYLDHEQRDPFATQQPSDYSSDWDRYAAQEYELLVAEDGTENH